jgi:hypothetical protein
MYGMSTPDRARAAELAALADAAATATWTHEVVLGIKQADQSEDALRLASAFQYRTDRDRPNTGDRFGPALVVTDEGARELSLAETPVETFEVWEAVAAEAAHVRVLATLHDLLFERGWGDVGAHGRRATEAYIAMIPHASSTLAEVDAVSRALTLIRITRNDELLRVAVSAVIDAIRAVLKDADDPKPGVSLRMLETLVDHHVPNTDIDELLTLCRATYTDPWNTVSTINLQRRRAPDADMRRMYDREEVQAWLDEAQRTDPLVAILHLETAAQLARQRGLPDLAETAVRAMQSVNPADIPLQTFSTSVEIPREEIDAQIDQLLSADTWFHAVIRIVASGPPSGDVEQNRQTAERMAEQFPLQSMFPTIRLGSDGLPRYQPTTEEQQADDRLAEHETLRIQLASLTLSEAFDRAAEKFGVPTSDDIVVALGRNPNLTDATRSSISRAIGRYYQGDAEGALYTAIPLVERLVRDLLLAIDAPIYRAQSQRAPGQYPGLGALLDELSRRGFDQSWYRYLRTLLASPNGLNLRNEALHGFVDEVGRETAAAVMVALIYLTGFRAQAQ